MSMIQPLINAIDNLESIWFRSYTLIYQPIHLLFFHPVRHLLVNDIPISVIIGVFLSYLFDNLLFLEHALCLQRFNFQKCLLRKYVRAMTRNTCITLRKLQFTLQILQLKSAGIIRLRLFVNNLSIRFCCRTNLGASSC